MEDEEDMVQDLGVVVAMINGEVDGDMMQDHLDHGAIRLVTEVDGVVVGVMGHMEEEERRKEDSGVEEEEVEGVIPIKIMMYCHLLQ